MDYDFKEIKLSPAKLFDLYIQGKGIKYKWIADNIGIGQSYLTQICHEQVPLTEKMREKINELLETNY